MNYVKCLSFIILLVGIGLPLSDIVSEGAKPENSTAKNQKKGEISLVDVEDVSAHPLRVGEKLAYKVKIGWIPTGSRVDRIVRKKLFDGKTVFEITSEAKTGAFARIYRFRNYQSTYLNVDGLHPVRFRNQLQDKKYSAIVQINYRDKEAEYEKISQLNPKAPKKRDNKVLDIPFGTQDELSMIYFLRRKKLVPGNTYFFPLISKGKVLKVRLKVERGKALKVKGLGVVRTLVVQTSEGSKLWLTDDPRHIPVRIEAEMKIGKVRANLDKYEILK